MDRKTTLSIKDRLLFSYSASLLKRAIIALFIIASTSTVVSARHISISGTSVDNGNGGIISGTPGSPLPIGIISFTATDIGDDNRLIWQTATERDEQSYTVERSEDGISYRSIATLPPQETDGNSNEVLTYRYIDHGANVRAHAPFLYRIRQDITDGSISYSNVVRLENRSVGSRELTAYPNPTTGIVSLDMSTGCNGDEPMNVIVVSAMGAPVLNCSFTAIGGHLSTSLDLTTLPAGTYYVQLRCASRSVQVQHVVLLSH